MEKKILEKKDLLMIKINRFFENTENITHVINILNNKYNISLRIVDWFVTNYCKKKNICWFNNTSRFVVYISYKLQLKAYSKKLFDPFCRRDRIYFQYDKDNYLITTVGQLNFFKWMIENNIIDYIKDNYEEIERDMHNTIKTTCYIVQKKRRELSKSAIKTINKNTAKIVLSFE
tara:strand:- start:5718 stop:6242 length:525 start_codon:yes stop_codon:yes gene_type:complete